MSEISLFRVHMPESVLEPLRQVLLSGYIGQGPKVEEFEKALIPWFGNPNVLTVNSCTSAIHLALRLVRAKYGTEVISTPMTCAATNEPILERGANIIWADINPWTGNIDPLDVSRKITSRTKAVIAVHWAGYPCDLDELLKTCAKHRIALIEDAAHAFGASYRGRPIGCHSDHVCFASTAPIMTNKGKKQISKVKAGDRVLASDGLYHVVTDVHKRLYIGNWSRIVAGQAKVNATSCHLVRVHRDGVDQWLQIGKICKGDSVYVLTKKCERCQSLVPIYGRVCGSCYLEANVCYKKRKKVQKARSTGNGREVSSPLHFKKAVLPWMLKYAADGYRVIPMAYAIPDFLAIRDGKITAVEVESGTSVRLGKERKYEKLGNTKYDNVVWITKKRKRDVAARYTYKIVGNLARVPVSRTYTKTPKRNRCVYNLTIADDATYFVHGVLVHNCFSFQAIKHITTGDGGALVCRNMDDYREGKLLRWYGIDRETPRKDLRCEEDIKFYGYKAHMNDIAAVIGLEQLKYVSGILEKHRANAKFYDERLGSLKNVKRLKYENDRISSYWLYTIRVDDRERFQEYMKSQGIMVSQVHVRNDIHTAFKAFRRNLPGVDEFTREQVSIPVGWWITPEEREKVARAIEQWDAR